LQILNREFCRAISYERESTNIRRTNALCRKKVLQWLKVNGHNRREKAY